MLAHKRMCLLIVTLLKTLGICVLNTSLKYAKQTGLQSVRFLITSWKFPHLMIKNCTPHSTPHLSILFASQFSLLGLVRFEDLGLNSVF